MVSNALVIVDVQNDFCQKFGTKTIQPINLLIDYAKKNNWFIVASQDWHSPSAFTRTSSTPHCLIDTPGANFPENLQIPNIPVIRKGKYSSGHKSYSAFNGDELSLDNLLKENHITHIYLAGITAEHCIKATAIDAIKRGYQTCLVSDACQMANPRFKSAFYREIAKLGIKIIKSSLFNIKK